MTIEPAAALRAVPSHTNTKGGGRTFETPLSRPTELNGSLNLIGKHESGFCECGKDRERVEHFICDCPTHDNPRGKLYEEFRKRGMMVFGFGLC